MATPSYATDLTDIITDMSSTTGWTLISSGGGGANTLTAPETDDYIQGSSCISRNPWTTANIRGMVYNSSQTIASGNAVFIWWKSDVAQALSTEAAGGVQILIGSSASDLKCFYVAGSDTYQIGGWRCAVIDPTTTPSTSLGSPSSTTSYFGVRWAIASSGPSKGYPYKIDAIRRGRSCTITAGDSGDPATWLKLGTYSGDTSRRWGLATPTDTGVQVQGVINWGSSGASVYSRDANKTVVFLSTKGFTSTSFSGIVIANASTDLEWDNIAFSALGTANRGTFAINNDAKAWLTNCVFSDMDTIAGGGANTKFDGSKFYRCNAITVAATPGSYLGIQVRTPTVAANASSLVWNSSTGPNGKLDGSTFVSHGSTAHHAIEFGTSSPTSITLTNMTFTGFGADASNGAALHIKRTSGTVTITLSGTTTPTYKTDGATVVFVTGAVNVTANASTIDGTAVSGARVLLYTTSATGTLPANVTVTISNSGTTATVTHASHGLATNDYVRIKNASLTANNGVFQITVTGTGSYTYTMGSAPGSSPTGTIKAWFVFLYGTTSGAGSITMSRSVPANQSVTGWIRKGTGSPLYKTAPLGGTVSSSSGLTLTGVMILDE